VAPRRPARDRLAGWLRRLSARVAHVAARLEPPAPNPEVPDGSSSAGGPPEHWLRMVRERAPELLDGGGIRADTTVSRPGDPLLPPPPVIPAQESPRRTTAGLPVFPSEGRGDARPAGRPARLGPGGHDGLRRSAPRPEPFQGPSPEDSAPVHGAPERSRVEPTPDERSTSEPPSAVSSNVDGPEPHTPEREGPPRQSPPRVPARFAQGWLKRPRRTAETVPVREPEEPIETGAARQPPATVTAGFPSAGTGPADDPSIAGTAAGSPPRWPPHPPMDAVHRPTTAVTPGPSGPSGPGIAGDPRPWVTFDAAPVPRAGDRPRAGPLVVVGPRATDGADSRWPPPPVGGPWPWATRRPGDRWPALPDDRTLWTPPQSAFTTAHVRRLDDEQGGA
jgi:hypothetical protein